MPPFCLRFDTSILGRKITSWAVRLPTIGFEKSPAALRVPVCSLSHYYWTASNELWIYAEDIDLTSMNFIHPPLCFCTKAWRLAKPLSVCILWTHTRTTSHNLAGRRHLWRSRQTANAPLSSQHQTVVPDAMVAQYVVRTAKARCRTFGIQSGI